MRIIVDACNFIYSHRRLSGMLDSRPFENIRRALCAEFARYRRTGRLRRSEIVLVFDGSGGDAWAPGFLSSHGVRAVFSDSGQTADERIIEILDGSRRPTECLVVTSDRSLAAIARGRGARTVRSDEFIRRMGVALRKASGSGDDEPPEKTRGSLSSGETDEWLRYFGIER